MTLAEFKESLKKSSPPTDASALLQAMWFDAKDDWEAAHNIAQDVHTKDGSWVHAYLHRREGDDGNAAYWYHRAGKPVYKKSLKDEWDEMVEALL